MLWKEAAVHQIIFEKPYRFYPPRESRFWPAVLRRILNLYLRRSHGIGTVEVHGEQRLRDSIAAGHGIMLAPNHCRPCDPMVLGHLAWDCGSTLFIMASRHLFEESRLQRFLLQRAGAFSIYREGMDREAIKCAIQRLTEARRPLVIFPEGVVSRTNDRLGPLMDGTAFIARNAAKQRAALPVPGKVVVHPVALRYGFEGNLDSALSPVLDDIEQRLTWKSPAKSTMGERIAKIGLALLMLKEMEFFDEVRSGEIEPRINALIDHLLLPLETEWIKGRREPDVVGRVKALRIAILPDMVTGDIVEAERVRRWRQLEECYLAQQLNFYPLDYFAPGVAPEKMLETVERFEDDLTDHVTIHGPIRAIINVGEAIEVSPVRERGGEGDPVMRQIREQLEALLQHHQINNERREVP